MGDLVRIQFLDEPPPVCLVRALDCDAHGCRCRLSEQAVAGIGNDGNKIFHTWTRP